ncbi:hypothetical protein [Burkholderia thailandensis]|nr:hypothetical protein [Burkholderia thailandensis]
MRHCSERLGEREPLERRLGVLERARSSAVHGIRDCPHACGADVGFSM